MKNNVYFDGWKQSFNLKGKTNRRDYWLFFLINVIISYALGAVSGTLENIFLLVSLFPVFAITCRRLNDVKKPLWWCIPGFLWCLILYLGFILPDTYRIMSYFLVGILGVIISPTVVILFIYAIRKSSVEGDVQKE